MVFCPVLALGPDMKLWEEGAAGCPESKNRAMRSWLNSQAPKAALSSGLSPGRPSSVEACGKIATRSGQASSEQRRGLVLPKPRCQCGAGGPQLEVGGFQPLPFPGDSVASRGVLCSLRQPLSLEGVVDVQQSVFPDRCSLGP